MSSYPVQKIIQRHKAGELLGICSICSANRYVLEAALADASEQEMPVLIEATCNQVNQFGGYTGMTPDHFVSYVYDLAQKSGYPAQKLILGGDHLGPSVWQNEPAGQAMVKAQDLVRRYVAAGFTKIHLDASMSCAGDPSPLPDEVVADRAARLCLEAESHQLDSPPVYVIGTEVPVPGGSRESLRELHVTPAEEVEKTISNARAAFARLGLESAWDRVIAIVVQPGVEFGSDSVVEYDRTAACTLSAAIERFPNLVFEAHSTDYQSRDALRALVEDHFAILKVGPWLTFAFREAVFALARIEEEILAGTPTATSRILSVIEAEMLADDQYWKRYYEGAVVSEAFERKYSLSDRIRYYWTNPRIASALDQLLRNLGSKPIPFSILSQYLPRQYEAVRAGRIRSEPVELIHDKISEVLEDYRFACGFKGRLGL